MSFTPGPYKFGHLGTEAFWIGPDHDQTPVAVVEWDTDTARDNARDNVRMLAAAPELLAALEGWLSAYDGWSQAELEKRVDPATISRIKVSRAIIAKARGAL